MLLAHLATHHSDTIVVGRDREVAFHRPVKARFPLKELLGLASNPENSEILLKRVRQIHPPACTLPCGWRVLVGCVALRSI
jgi:hypothetical protein